jgi:hypothetical protein
MGGGLGRTLYARNLAQTPVMPQEQAREAGAQHPALASVRHQPSPSPLYVPFPVNPVFSPSPFTKRT